MFYEAVSSLDAEQTHQWALETPPSLLLLTRAPAKDAALWRPPFYFILKHQPPSVSVLKVFNRQDRWPKQHVSLVLEEERI